MVAAPIKQGRLSTIICWEDSGKTVEAAHTITVSKHGTTAL